MSYPLSGYHFQVEWGGERVGFEEISGLEVKTQVIEYREGNYKDYHSLKMPGRTEYGNIKLSRGVFEGDNELFEWFNTIMLNKVERRDITISLLNEVHEPVVVWKIKNAFPAGLKWDRLDSNESKVFLEYVELAHEGLAVENNSSKKSTKKGK